MKTKQAWCITALVVIFSTLLVSPLFAEEPLDGAEYSPCCWGDLPAGGSGANRDNGSRGRYYRNYDFQSTETLDGEVNVTPP